MRHQQVCNGIYLQDDWSGVCKVVSFLSSALMDMISRLDFAETVNKSTLYVAWTSHSLVAGFWDFQESKHPERSRQRLHDLLWPSFTFPGSFKSIQIQGVWWLRPYLSMGEVSKNWRSYFKTATLICILLFVYILFSFCKLFEDKDGILFSFELLGLQTSLST